MADPWCSEVSRELNEPLLGTASRVRDWLLVEQPGPWGYEAVLESRLSPDVAAGLKRIAGRYRIRLLLIRRVNGSPEPASPRCYAVHSGLDDQWIQSLEVDTVSSVLDIDLSGMPEGERPNAGRPWEGPLYLVCTHGQHDRCCARYGEPVARSLAGERAEETWEVSHVGGDRFAANLVCLPHGLYFGRVEPADAAEVAGLYEQGLIHLDHYRGRSCYEPVVQAGDVFVRQARGLPGIDDLVPESRRDHERGTSMLAFRDRFGASHEVQVAVSRASKRLITCGSGLPGSPRAYTARFGEGSTGSPGTGRR